MPHVFISYVRDDKKLVNRLATQLSRAGIKVWIDRDQIKPGQRWKDTIKKAIEEGAYFIACFSQAYEERSHSYMNEELILAIEELRKKPTNRTWFIPLLLNQTSVPERAIGAGETLRDIHWIDLSKNWDAGDDKEKEIEHQQLLKSLNDLNTNVQFVGADVKAQLNILSKNFEDTNKEIAKLIKKINPVQLEAEICQFIFSLIVNASTVLTAEDVVSLFRQAGFSISNLTMDENPNILAKQLLDSAIQTGKLEDVISELEIRYPHSFRKIENDSEEAEQAAINEFIEASRSLLTWPKTIGEGKWIERKEVSLLENIIYSNERSTTLLLGKPGTGKSALLSFLATNLIQKGYPVLGIKADMLPKVITDSKDLQNYLKLSFPIIESLVRCSEDKHAVLIIDQLLKHCAKNKYFRSDATVGAVLHG